jgi:hypothetical protein
MKKSKKIMFLILSLCCINVYAAERLYKIELVVFSQEMPNTEVFDQTESRIAWPRKVVKTASYETVSPEDMNLHGSYVQLSRARSYQALMHVAWVQPVKENRLSTAVQISNEDGTINGFFRLQRGHLVHMIADIEYSPASYDADADPVIFRLNEKRRFKLNEIHYLDHPKFGIIARISPVSLSE